MSKSAKRATRTLCVFVLVLAGGVSTTVAANAAAKRGDPADAVEAYERDVFEIVGSTLRNPGDTTSPDAALFNNAGAALGLNWGQWKAASASSTMRVGGGRTDASLVLSGLVPNGVYSVFYGTIGPDSENPLCLNVERALPFTSTNRRQLPDRSSFVARPDGTASYAGQVDGNLLSATQVFIEIVYHFDGQTYGSLPNRGEWLTQGQSTCRSSFGDDAMRQLLILQKL